jgi:hypothetical protein
MGKRGRNVSLLILERLNSGEATGGGIAEAREIRRTL